jgi:hypothetical protein
MSEPHKILTVSTPIFRAQITRDRGESWLAAGQQMQSHLSARKLDKDGNVLEERDLGSGLTTQGLALALANEVSNAANVPALKNLQYMASGTGTTAATAFDIQLQTAAGPVSSIITPTVTVSALNSVLTWVGTITYAGTLAITEMGLFGGTGTIGSQYTHTNAGDTFAATTYTPNVSPSWTVNQWAGDFIVQVASSPSVFGGIISNTATALTISPSWVNQNAGGGSGSTPAANTAVNIYPLLGDHRIFSPINVVNTNQIQFTYSLVIASGG